MLLLCCCSYLSSIHEKANCIAIFWTGRPHSLGSCLFRGVWATCLPHNGGGVPLSALPKDTTCELAGLFSTISHKCRAPKHRRSQGGAIGAMAPLNFKSNYKTVSKKQKHKPFCASAGALEFVVDI